MLMFYFLYPMPAIHGPGTKQIDFNKYVSLYLIGNFSSRKKNTFSCVYYLNKNFKVDGKALGVLPEVRLAMLAAFFQQRWLYTKDKSCALPHIMTKEARFFALLARLYFALHLA